MNKKLKNLIGAVYLEMQIYRKALLEKRFISRKNKFIIFGQGRTGSTLLCSLLRRHDAIDCRDELLFHRRLNPARYIEGLCAEGGETFGFHLKIYQLTELHKIRDPRKFLQRFYDAGWKLIYLRREDVLRHAISGLIAHERKVWHVKASEVSNEELDLKAVALEPIEVERWIRKRVEYSEEERAILQGFDYHEIVYERDLQDSDCHGETIAKVFDFLGLCNQEVKSNLLRISTDNLADSVSNIDEVFSHLKRCGLGACIEGLGIG